MEDPYKADDGEWYDESLVGRRVRMDDGRTGVILGHASSCYSPYDVELDGTGECIAASCISFTVIVEAQPPS